MQPRKTISANTHSDVVTFADGKAYYLGQLAGWSFYGILQYLLTPGPRAPGTMVSVAAWCCTGIVGTHLLRVYVQHRRRETVPQLLGPFAIAIVTIPAAMNAARMSVNTLIFKNGSEGARQWLILVHYFQALLVICVWCAVFLSVNEVRRRRLAETESLRLALLVQGAQFHALRSQLNPHFLFNCLNSLRELIDEDSNRAKQVVELLSDLLRYTLRAGRVETVQLMEELQAVKDYLSLEKVRFEERLNIYYDIDPNSLQVKLPAMLLQTLTENGVKHGIARLPAGGDLSIVTRVIDHSLHIEVTNSGSLSSSRSDFPAVGLDNARERLRLMYDDNAVLTLSATEDGRVRATVVIPSLHSRSIS